MKTIARSLPVILLVCILSGQAAATTWFPKDFTCPIDGTKNTFMVVGSYGSYIYSWPSKYQWLFFPQTESPTYYICKKCHLTTYMWDFDKLPKNKIEALKTILANVKVSKAFKDYREIPVTERLEVMEKVYAALDKDQDWWESFYRVKGYHFGKEGNTAKAAEARKRSLEILQKAQKDPKNESPKKLSFYVSGAMKHFMGDDEGAVKDLEQALATKYAEKDATPEAIKEAEDGLNERLTEYIALIKSTDKKPRLFDKQTDDDH